MDQFKMKRSALHSDKTINKKKMASSCFFSGNNLNVTFPKVGKKGVCTGMSISKYFLFTYLMLTNYMLLMADIMEPVRNGCEWL